MELVEWSRKRKVSFNSNLGNKKGWQQRSRALPGEQASDGDPVFGMWQSSGLHLCSIDPHGRVK